MVDKIIKYSFRAKFNLAKSCADYRKNVCLNYIIKKL
jgi:hypothetical protein